MRTPSFTISRIGASCLSHSGFPLFSNSFGSLRLSTSGSFHLIRPAAEAIEHVLDVHVACDKPCSLFRHRAQQPFPASVDECDFVKIDDSPASGDPAGCHLPVRF